MAFLSFLLLRLLGGFAVSIWYGLSEQVFTLCGSPTGRVFWVTGYVWSTSCMILFSLNDNSLIVDHDSSPSEVLCVGRDYFLVTPIKITHNLNRIYL